MKTTTSKLQNHKLYYESLPDDISFIAMLKDVRKEIDAARARRRARLEQRRLERYENSRVFYEGEV